MYSLIYFEKVDKSVAKQKVFPCVPRRADPLHFVPAPRRLRRDQSARGTGLHQEVFRGRPSDEKGTQGHQNVPPVQIRGQAQKIDDQT